jgi:hypothetical protein
MPAVWLYRPDQSLLACCSKTVCWVTNGSLNQRGRPQFATCLFTPSIPFLMRVKCEFRNCLQVRLRFE